MKRKLLLSFILASVFATNVIMLTGENKNSSVVNKNSHHVNMGLQNSANEIKKGLVKN